MARDAVQTSPRGLRTRAWAYACVVLAAVLLYLPSFRHGFIGYDDTLLVVDDAAFLSDPGNALQAFRRDAFDIPGYRSSGAYYRPVLTLSLMLDAQIGGTSPWIYHVSNVLQHAAASALLLAFLTALGTGLPGALAAALLFAAHPALAGVVSWVPGRVDALLALFLLASALGGLSYLRKGGWGGAALHLAGYALAAFTKEIGVLLPIPLTLWALAEPQAGRRRLLRLAPAWGAILVAWFLLREAALTRSGVAADLLSNVGSNLIVLVHYIGKTFVPAFLSVAPTLADTPVYPGLIAAAALAVALARSRSRNRARVVLGAAWFLTFALPPLLVPRVVGLEQRLYAPMAGLLILLLEAGAAAAVERRRWARWASAAVILVFAALTLQRQPVFGDRLRFWENAVASSPHSSYARASLGAIYLARGRVDEARAHYQRAVELNPAEPKANLNLGVIAGRAGRTREAQEHFRRETVVNPGYADAWFNLAQSHAYAGDLETAVALWRRTLEVDPGHVAARQQLARVLARPEGPAPGAP